MGVDRWTTPPPLAGRRPRSPLSIRAWAGFLRGFPWQQHRLALPEWLGQGSAGAGAADHGACPPSSMVSPMYFTDVTGALVHVVCDARNTVNLFICVFYIFCCSSLLTVGLRSISTFGVACFGVLSDGCSRGLAIGSFGPQMAAACQVGSMVVMFVLVESWLAADIG